MDLLHELGVAFVMAVLAAWLLEAKKPGKITGLVLWVVSRLVPKEIRQDHLEDWISEVEGIRVDGLRRGPFAPLRFVVGQVTFAQRLRAASRRLRRADPNYLSGLFLVLSTPGVGVVMAPFLIARGVQNLNSGNLVAGLVQVVLSLWMLGGAAYIIRGARRMGTPIVLGRVALIKRNARSGR